MIGITIGIIAFAVCFIGIAILVDAQCKPDSSREKLGLGPKGQGR